jgi:cob(I)alamin adenosyltransferase
LALKIYTKKGDDGTTGLLFGGRVSKDDAATEAYGTVDESVAVLGTARARAPVALAERVLAVQRDLFVVAAELATLPENRTKLEPGVSLTTPDMVQRLERWIDEAVEEVGLPSEFMVPGQNDFSAALDHARTVIRRAERRCVTYAHQGGLPDSEIIRYLNRLADYLYMLVRVSEAEWLPSRTEKGEP